MRVDPLFVQNLSSPLQESTLREATLTGELSSGLRVSTLSADPTVTAQSALLNSEVNQQENFKSVAATQTGRLQVADSVLEEAVTQLTSAITLSTEATSGALNSANLSSIQSQVTSLRDGLLSLANTSYTGSYLFSGSAGNTQPFSLNNGTTPATVTYSGDSHVQSIVTPGGQAIPISLSGTAIFTQALTALNQLVADLSTANPQAAANADTSALNSALTQLSSQRTIVGNSLSRIQATSTYAQTQEANLKIEQSTLVSADPVAVATELSATETQHSALLSVIAALSKSTLFDYLK